MKNIDKYLISESVNIRNAIKRIDKGGIGFIAVVDGNNHIKGIVTDGDFRRAVLAGIDLEENVLLITNKSYKYLAKGFSSKDAMPYFRGEESVEWLPVLDSGVLVDIISKEDVSIKYEDVIPKTKQLDLPVVIMAGGKGTRLDPFTRILPKALIPLGEKPIIEVIMDKFAVYGVSDFIIAVNHKHKMIKAFFEDRKSKYNISYIDEDKPLGTAGAIKLLENQINTPFFVSNCDIIIKCDYSSILNFHQENNATITIVASMQHHTIPYGICELKDNGSLDVIKEKPEYDFLVNTGMYILNPEILSYIPHDTYFDMTDLINAVKKDNQSVSIYPVSEKSWIDVGQWEEYVNSNKIFTG